jgi:hypothetical protein
VTGRSSTGSSKTALRGEAITHRERAVGGHRVARDSRRGELRILREFDHRKTALLEFVGDDLLKSRSSTHAQRSLECCRTRAKILARRANA